MFTDNPQELQRLTQRYAAAGDEELIELAAEFDTLTEEAQQALRGELSKRGLEDSMQRGGEAAPEMQSLVMVARVPEFSAAMLAKTRLESCGITCILADENMVRIYGGISHMFGGIKLLVRGEDAEAAREVLAETPETPPQEEEV